MEKDLQAIKAEAMDLLVERDFEIVLDYLLENVTREKKRNHLILLSSIRNLFERKNEQKLITSEQYTVEKNKFRIQLNDYIKHLPDSNYPASRYFSTYLPLTTRKANRLIIILLFSILLAVLYLIFLVTKLSTF